MADFLADLIISMLIALIAFHIGWSLGRRQSCDSSHRRKMNGADVK